MKSMDVVRTARRVYLCEDGSCGGAIQPGERYVYATSPPWDDMWDTGQWDHLRVCRRCSHNPECAAPDTATATDTRPTEGNADG